MFGLRATTGNTDGQDRPLVIEVRGTSSITRIAERAVLYVSVSAEGTDKETVTSQATTTARQLQALTTELSPRDPATDEATAEAAVTAWTMRALSTSAYTPRDHHSGADLERRHIAATNFELEFRDFAKLGTAAARLLAMPHVSVCDTRWRLTEKTKKDLGSRSRKEAVEEAMSKAKDYAEAAGYKGVRPFEILDGYSGEECATELPGGKMVGGAEDAVLSFVPEEISLKSSVTVKFYAE